MSAVRLEQRVEKRLGNLVLADQRIRQQRLQRGRAIAVHRSPDREPLVRLHLLDQPEHLRRERGERVRLRASRANARRDLDHRVVGKIWQRAVVADVDDLLISGICLQRGDQLGRRLAVVSPAPALQQRRLFVEALIATPPEPPPFYPHPPCPTLSLAPPTL